MAEVSRDGVDADDEYLERERYSAAPVEDRVYVLARGAELQRLGIYRDPAATVAAAAWGE